MRFIEDLIPLRLYSEKKKMYVPFNPEDKKKGAAIMLLGKRDSTISKLTTLPYIYNPRFFAGLFIQRNAMAYINSEGSIIDSYDTTISDILNEGLYHKEYKDRVSVIFDNANIYDKNIVSHIIDSNYLRILADTFNAKLTNDVHVHMCFTEKELSDILPKKYKGKMYSYTNDNTIYLLSKYSYDEKTMDGPYYHYVCHEAVMSVILQINPNINRGLAEYIAAYLAGQHEFDSEVYKKADILINGAKAIEDINKKYGLNKIAQIIKTNDFAFVTKFIGKTYSKSVISHLMFESGDTDLEKFTTKLMADNQKSVAIIIDNSMKHNYYYHLEPKGNDVSNGLRSIYYYKKEKMLDELKYELDKYRDDVCGKWGIYTNKYPATLTTEEIVDAIKKIRGPHGDKYITFFKFPPKTYLSDNIKNLLQAYDLYRVDIPELKDGEVADIQWKGEEEYVGGNMCKSSISISDSDPFICSLRREIDKNAIDSLETIGIAMKDGCIDSKYIQKINITDRINVLTEDKTRVPNIPIEEMSNYAETGYLSTPNYVRMVNESRQNGKETIFFFNEMEAPDSSTYDTRLRKYLFKDRIKNNREIMNLYADVKTKNPHIIKTYLYLAMYQKRNIFIDLSYYHNLFLQNNTYNMDKAIYMYWDFLNRLMSDEQVDKLYPKQTIFIPVDAEDWGAQDASELYNYKVNMNPISAIIRLARINPELLRAWANKRILFCSKRGYFVMDFSNFMFKNTARMRMHITKLNSSQEINDDPDSFDNDDQDPEGVITPEEKKKEIELDKSKEIEGNKKDIAMKLIDITDKAVKIDDVSKVLNVGKKEEIEAQDLVEDLVMVKKFITSKKLPENTTISSMGLDVGHKFIKNKRETKYVLNLRKR